MMERGQTRLEETNSQLKTKLKSRGKTLQLKLHVFQAASQEICYGGLIFIKQAVASTPAPHSKRSAPRTALPEAFESFSPNQQPPGGQERRYKPLPQCRWPPVPRQGTRHPFEPSPLLDYHHSGGEVALALTSTVRPPKSCLSSTF